MLQFNSSLKYWEAFRLKTEKKSLTQYLGHFGILKEEHNIPFFLSFEAYLSFKAYQPLSDFGIVDMYPNLYYGPEYYYTNEEG